MERIPAIEVTTKLRNNAIKYRRVSLGLSQAQLAEKVGSSQNQIAMCEAFFHKRKKRTGEVFKQRPSQDIIQRLADFFECDPSALYPAWAKEVEEHTVIKTLNEEEFFLSYYDARNEPLQIEDQLANTEEVRRLLELTNLAPRPLYILTRLYGLDGQPSCTLVEVAEELNVSRERVRQIQQKALSSLRWTACKTDIADGHRCST